MEYPIYRHLGCNSCMSLFKVQAYKREITEGLTPRCVCGEPLFPLYTGKDLGTWKQEAITEIEMDDIFREFLRNQLK